MKFSEPFILINLKKLSDLKKIKELLKLHNIEDSSAKEILEMREDGYLRLYLDKKTHYLVAFTHEDNKGKLEFTEEFLKFVKRMHPIGFPDNELNVDDILDKISETGLESLTKREKKWLRKN